MSAFEYEDISHPYYLRPNAAPWASVAPTIVFRGRTALARDRLPGQRADHALDPPGAGAAADQTPFDAVAAPRLHCSLDGQGLPRGLPHARRHPRALRRHGFDDRRAGALLVLPRLRSARACEARRAHRRGRPAARRLAAAGPAMKLPLLISVPHAGLEVPPEVATLLHADRREIVEDGDEGAARSTPSKTEVAAFVTTEVARAIVDMNRAEDDRRQGRGGQDPHLLGRPGVRARSLRRASSQSLLETLPSPYHASDANSARTAGLRLGVDCHTMAAFGPPVGPDPGAERPGSA